MNPALLLPRAALARWQAVEAALPDGLAGWVARLLARMTCSGGRVSRLLIETGLCEVADIVACVTEQLAAGPLPDNPLMYDVEADLGVVGELAPLDDAVALSARLAGVAWIADADGFHGDVADRLLAAGRDAEVEEVLGRIGWHRVLVEWIEKQTAIEAGLRARLIARAAGMIAGTHLPREHHVELYVELAVVSGDRKWIEEARGVLATLPAELVVATPDRTHPVESLAWGLARLGCLGEALAELGPLDRRDRWTALLRLLPCVAERAAIVEELIAGVLPLELSWMSLVEAAPEAAPAALRAIAGISDEALRAEEMAGVARFLKGEEAREVCEWLLARAESISPGAPGWERAWEDVLDALTASGCEALLSGSSRRRLIEALSARPDVDLWREAGPFVPAELAEQVLALTHRGLLVADHYTSREAWIGLGEPLLANVPRAQAEAWLALAAAQMAGTAMDGRSVADLSVWTPEQRRSIVRARFAQHMLEFLPRQLLGPLLLALARALPVAQWPDWDGWIDADVLARLRAREELDAVVGLPVPDTNAWPDFDTFVGVVLGAGAEGAARVVELCSAARRTRTDVPRGAGREL